MRAVWLLLLCFLWASPGLAQGVPATGQVVSPCGTASGYVAPQIRSVTLSPGGQLCVGATGTPAPTTNLSGTITLGNTFQSIAPASTVRLSLDFINRSGNGDVCLLYLGTLGSAGTTNAIAVLDGQEYLRSTGAVPSDQINATCATTGDHFYLAVE